MDRKKWAMPAFGIAILIWVAVPYVRGAIAHHATQTPLVLEFGRGSGRNGLSSVRVAKDGSVVLFRYVRHRNDVESTSLVLRERQMYQIHQAIRNHQVENLDRKYSRSIADGEQWILRINVNDEIRSTYFNNNFPPNIEAFADELELVLAEAGLTQEGWRTVRHIDGWRHDRELWDSIR
jgi:hypothetical protein